MKTDNRYYNYPEHIPEVNTNLEVISSDGDRHYVFLCKCGQEWRCAITGSGMLIDVVKWRYKEEDKGEF